MKVSICIPQYNRCDALRLVIQDILDQTYADFELIICDDASVDDTIKVVSEFNDPRIRYSRNLINLGLYPNFNRCLDLAQGEYIAIYHNHDRYSPDIIARSVELLNNNPHVGFVHTGTISLSPGGHGHNYVQDWPEVANGKWFAEHLIRRWDSPVHQPTVMARRILYDHVGRYDAQRYAACADSAIWIRMCVNVSVGYIALPLMSVTPRQEHDFYGVFDWHDILGMARAHRLGLDLLRETWGDDRYYREKRMLQYRHDRHFILLLLQWLARGDSDCIQKGMEAIEQECSPRAIWISHQAASIGDRSQPILDVLANLYGRGIRLKGRLDNLRGQRISRRYLQQVSDK